jgi:hypothetical protein
LPTNVRKTVSFPTNDDTLPDNPWAQQNVDPAHGFQGKDRWNPSLDAVVFRWLVLLPGRSLVIT